MNARKPSGIQYTKAAIASDDLFGRIAASKESQAPAQAILLKYGYAQAKTENELAHKLASIVMNVGDLALKDVASIHPDKELILSLFQAAPSPLPLPVQESIKPKSLNDCGCGSHHNNTGGSPAAATQVVFTPESVGSDNKYMKPALLISVSLLLVAVAWKSL
jgi:hypothetical protein